MLAVALASQPITSSNLLDALCTEAAQQYLKLSPHQQKTVVAKLQAMPIKIQDAKSLRFSQNGKVQLASSLRACLRIQGFRCAY